jgi:hypothetical protein
MLSCLLALPPGVDQAFDRTQKGTHSCQPRQLPAVACAGGAVRSAGRQLYLSGDLTYTVTIHVSGGVRDHRA